MIAAGNENYHLQKALEESTGKLQDAMTQQGRHALNAAQRREQLGETGLKGIDTSDHTCACVSGLLFVCITVKIWSSLEHSFLI